MAAPDDLTQTDPEVKLSEVKGPLFSFHRLLADLNKLRAERASAGDIIAWAHRNPRAAQQLVDGTAAVIPLTYPTLGWPALGVAYAQKEGDQQCTIRDLEWTRLDRPIPGQEKRALDQHHR